MWRGRTRTVGWVWLAVATLTVAMAAACYTVADPHAGYANADPDAGYAKPIDPTTLGDMSRGVVIEGICPAQVEPMTVASDSDNSNWGHDRELRAMAYADKVVLNWEAPDVPNLSGYIVARERNGSDFDDSTQIFRMEAFASIGQQEEYADSDGIMTATWYTYQVFPLTAGGIEAPSAPVTIWTPPDGPPPSPSYVNASVNSDSEIGIGVRFGFHAWKKGVRIARRSAGESEWRIVHEEPRENGRDYHVDEHHYWADERVDARLAQEYAVCVSNAHGYGRATLADVAAYAKPVTVPVGPPRNIRSIVSRNRFVVYWDPLDDESVTGYEMERDKACYIGSAYWVHRIYDPAENFGACPLVLDPPPTHRVRVRAMTKDGPGPWSDYLEVDTSFDNRDDSGDLRPEIVSLNASYNAVYAVWDDGRDDEVHNWMPSRDAELQHRILRRRAGLDEDYQARLSYGHWVDLDDFDWEEHAQWMSAWDWYDHDLQPDTLYEYTVQLKRGETVEPPLEPKVVRTDPLPLTEARKPIYVRDFRATPHARGILLTWYLPEDPTLTGLRLRWHCEGLGSAHHCTSIGPVLSSDATSYLVSSYDYYPEGEFCFWMQTINDYGLQSTWGNPTCIDGSELSHCQATQESTSLRAGVDIGLLITIELDACEESEVHVIRRELTADGFEVTRSRQQCAWMSHSELGWESRTDVLSWWYIDADIKPGTWYIYEIRRKLRNGEELTTFHNRVTPSYSNIEDDGDWDPCVRPDHRRLSGAFR